MISTALAAALLMAPPRFAMAEGVTIYPLDATAPGAEMRSSQCVEGKVAPRLPVLLLGAKGSETCQATTEEEVTQTETGWDCTVIKVKEPCTHGWLAAVVGAQKGVFRRLEPQVVADAGRLEAFRVAIVTAGVAEAATAGGRASKALAMDERIEPIVASAIVFPGLPGKLAFVHLRGTGTAAELGPWVVFEGGKPATVIGPLAFSKLSAFTLDGAGFVQAERAGCTECGAVTNEIHAVEGTRLRRVFESAFGSN